MRTTIESLSYEELNTLFNLCIQASPLNTEQYLAVQKLMHVVLTMRHEDEILLEMEDSKFLTPG